MTRYALMYAAWLGGVFAMAGLALVWYKHVEEIGYRELADRMKPPTDSAMDATEDTEVAS